MGSSQPARPQGIFIDRNALEDGGLAFAQLYTGPIRDSRSLHELRDAVRARGRLGLAVMGAEFDELYLGPHSSTERIVYGAKLLKNVGLLSMYENRFDEAAARFDQALEIGKRDVIPWKDRAELLAIRGVIALRHGRSAIASPALVHRVASFRSHPKLLTPSRPARARRSSTSRPTWRSCPATCVSAGS
ncbi:MAG: hypothetical protein JWN86_95 [Planctomycetota bacterium]|nr:hypothetical protein [Planctomycetota bacterium]